MQNTKPCRVNLHILSPIHIGAGQELDPFSYTIKDNTLLIFDPLKWMEGYEKKEELYSYFDSEDYIVLRAYIAENFNDDGAVKGAIPVKSPDVVSKYRNAILDKQSKNQGLVNFMTRNEIAQEPYIPGSSIKGAIRTAVANRFVKTAHVMQKDKMPPKNPNYNKKIFGEKLPENPMKNLKIADVPLSNTGSFIYEAKEHSAKPDKTPKGAFEATASLCETNSPVVLPLHTAFAPLNFKPLNKTVDLQGLVDCLYDFYIPKYIKEYDKFYSEHNNIQEAIAPMSMAAAGLKSNETFIRIGHFSHVECVTLDDVRAPQARKGYGKTRTLAEGVYPFGWAKLEFVDLPTNPRPEREWPFSVDAVKKNAKAKIEAAKKAKADKIQAEKIKKEAEQKRIAEKKRKEELDNMSPENRLLAEAKEAGAKEETFNRLANQLDKFPEPLKVEAADLLKQRWQAQNKWVKKDFSNKQWKKWRDKINRVKTILGEV